MIRERRVLRFEWVSAKERTFGGMEPLLERAIPAPDDSATNGGGNGHTTPSGVPVLKLTLGDSAD